MVLTDENRALQCGQPSNDPWLPDLGRCVDAGESIIENLYVRGSEEKLERLTDLILQRRRGTLRRPAGPTLHPRRLAPPKVFANTAKHLAFTRGGELNVFGMVDAQIALIEDRLLANNAMVC